MQSDSQARCMHSLAVACRHSSARERSMYTGVSWVLDTLPPVTGSVCARLKCFSMAVRSYTCSTWCMTP